MAICDLVFERSKNRIVFRHIVETHRNYANIMRVRPAPRRAFYAGHAGTIQALADGNPLIIPGISAPSIEGVFVPHIPDTCGIARRRIVPPIVWKFMYARKDQSATCHVDSSSSVDCEAY